MNHPRRMCLFVFVSLFSITVSGGERESDAVRPPRRLELRDGDRVVFLGNTLVERAQTYGHWETALTAAWPSLDISFRNLGWSGDTVKAESRGMFDPPEKGYERMLAQVRELKPTVVFLGYGNNAAFDGDAGRSKFLADYEKLMQDLQASSPADVRFVVVSPIPPPPVAPPLPDPAAQNARVKVYSQALEQLAERKNVPFVDLYGLLDSLWGDNRFDSKFGGPPTDDGVHLNDRGYCVSTAAFRQLIDGSPRNDSSRVVPETEPMKKLRQAIIEKNRLYFHHWRPQNITYLFGFRKHEQGQNAPEVAEFKKLVAEAEAEIARLRKAVADDAATTLP